MASGFGTAHFGPTGTYQGAYGPGMSSRHGTAERGYGGNFGLTPPSSPPRRSNTPNRRPGRGSDREPSNAGSRERSRDRNRSPSQTNRMPEEWGGRTLRSERLIAELTQRVANVEGQVNMLKNHADAESNRMGAIEAALPQRMHSIEERQASHVELLNNLSRLINDQLVTMNHRVSKLEAPSPAAAGGGGGPAHFGMATPPDSPFAPTNAQEPRPTPTFTNLPHQAPPDPWAQSRWAQPPSPASAPSTRGNEASRDFNRKEWSISDKKVSKQLIPFDGNPSNYKNWNERVRDHCKEVNSGWSYVFHAVESSKVKLHLSDCAYWTMPNGAGVDLRWASQHLWSFIRSNITNTVHMRCLTLTMNEDDNGFELWRMLFLENEGGAEQVEIAGMNDLHAFPQCPSASDVLHYTGQWNITRMKYGNDLPDQHLRQMYLNMLPEKIAADIRDKRECDTLQKCMDQVMRDIHRYNDGKLAKIHSQRLKHMLSQGPKNSINALVSQEEQPQRAESGEQSMMYMMAQKMDGLVAALNNQNGAPRGRQQHQQTGGQSRQPSPRQSTNGLPRPNPRFKGCWCCGKEGHSRQNCEVFQEIIKKNGGKVPTNYKGAYERFLEKKGKTVSALTEVEEQEMQDEFAETQVWAFPEILPEDDDDTLLCGTCEEDDFPSLSRESLKAMPMPVRVPPTPTSNKFSALDDDNDEKDDEEDMLRALQQLSPNIQVGQKLSQRQRKTQNSSPTLTKHKIAALAEQVRTGEISLPSIDLDNDNDYEAVWALVDSGAGRPCANRRKHFPDSTSPMIPSKVRLSTATAEEVKSRGVFKVKCMTAEGNPIEQEFEDIDVDMPILAVTCLAANGEKGSQVIFRKQDGEIVDLSNNRSSNFVKRRGVYFIKLFIKKDQPSKSIVKKKKPDFTRPGTN